MFLAIFRALLGIDMGAEWPAGAVLSMEHVLKSPVFFLGLSLPEHGYHAPNENFDWPQAEGGMAAFADYFRRIGALNS